MMSSLPRSAGSGGLWAWRGHTRTLAVLCLALALVGHVAGDGSAADPQPATAHAASPTSAAHGGHGGHDHTSKMVTGIAVCLFGFLVMNFSFLYLVNYRDEDVRAYIYRMISTTISIFCAVLLNEAVNSFFIKQLLVAPWPRGLHLPLRYREKFVVGVSLFTVSFFLINYLCYRFSQKYGGSKVALSYLYAVAQIGGHLCAFAGIFTFGELQQKSVVKESKLKVFGVVVLAFIFCTVYRIMSHNIRTKLESPYGHHRLREAGEHEEEEEEWIEHAEEAEDEAASLIYTYLMHQCIGYLIFGSLPNFEREAYGFDMRHVKKFFQCALFFLCLLLVASLVDVTERAEKIRKRMIFGMQTLITMSMCWCIQTGSEWLCILLVGDRHLAAVIVGFVLTYASMVFILFLDAIADRLGEEPPTATPAALAGKTPLSSRVNTRALSRIYAGHTQARFKRRLMTGVNLQSLRTWESWERALRKMINGFGLLVGLSWDKAFDVGELGIVTAWEPLRTRPVVSRFVLAIALVSFVLPAWIFYIVPWAQKSEADFVMQIKEEMKNDMLLEQEGAESEGDSLE